MTSLDLARRPLSELSRNEAGRLTQKIRDHAEKAWALLKEAHDKKAWAAMGYTSFEAYCRDEFGMSRGNAYRLLGQASVIGEIAAAAGLSPAGDIGASISDRAARELKPALPAVVEEVRSRVKGTRKAARPAIVAGIVEEARAALAEPIPAGVLESDTRRLVQGVAAWAAASGVSFHDAVDRLLGRLKPPDAPARPERKASAAADCRHPVNRRMGEVCMACMAKVGKG